MLGLGFCLNLILKSYPARIGDCQTFSRGSPAFDPDPSRLIRDQLLNAVLSSGNLPPFSRIRPRASRPSVVMLMGGGRRCLWFLGAVFKSPAIHPLRNIGGVSRTRLGANTDSTADSPRCPRCTETIHGPRVANRKARC